jgi:hypothetical protein
MDDEIIQFALVVIGIPYSIYTEIKLEDIEKKD